VSNLDPRADLTQSPIIWVSLGCQGRVAPAPHDVTKREQVLPLTLGGFLKDGPEAERVQGVCGPDNSRNLLNCDIYNGLLGWTITEVTLYVSWSPYEKKDLRYYQVPVTIQPQTTEHVTVRLGLQLPPDEVDEVYEVLHHGKFQTSRQWAWQNIGAKGYPAN
jgi:hypothetical protein